MTLRIYTKTGDDGTTGLFGGGRVHKHDARVEAYGEVDELNSTIGFAIAIAGAPAIDDVLARVQRDLFSIGAILATPDREKMQEQLTKACIDEERVAEIEHAIDEAELSLSPLKAFVLPGGVAKAAALHVARTVCRRAERRVVHVARSTDVPATVITYLNRLSDLLFTQARLANHLANTPEVTW